MKQLQNYSYTAESRPELSSVQTEQVKQGPHIFRSHHILKINLRWGRLIKVMDRVSNLVIIRVRMGLVLRYPVFTCAKLASTVLATETWLAGCVAVCHTLVL